MIKHSMLDWITDDLLTTLLNLLHVAIMIEFLFVANKFHYAYHAIIYVFHLLDFMTNLDHESFVYCYVG
jgi:hypothetical protein